MLEKFKNLETKHKIIVIAVIVLIIGLIIYFVYKKKKSSSEPLTQKVNKKVEPVSYRELEEQVDQEYENKNNKEETEPKQETVINNDKKVTVKKEEKQGAKVVSMDQDPALKKVE